MATLARRHPAGCIGWGGGDWNELGWDGGVFQAFCNFSLFSIYSIPKFPFVSTGLIRSPAYLAAASLGRSKWPLEPARPRWGARNGCSSPLGFAGACEMAARTRSASLGLSKSLLRPARPRWGARIGRSSPLRPARPRWSTQIRRSSPLRLAGALDIAAQAHSDEETCEKTIWKRCALVAIRSEHLARLISALGMDMPGPL